MTRAHFAGLNTAMFAEVLEGHPVLISYADIIRRPGVWRDEILPRLQRNAYLAPILDSGAFTELTTQGFHVSIEEYSEFVLEYGSLFDQVITLDDIGGDIERTWLNTAYLLDDVAGIDGIGTVIPVFHGREPIEVLHHYCQRFERVAIGFARDFGRISPDQGNGASPDAWLRQVLDVIEGYGVDVHGLGMTRYARQNGHGRLTTTDSTTWIAEFRALSKGDGGRSHGTRGAARDALDGLSRIQLAKLAVLSYYGHGACEGMRQILADSWGQARTAFRRYSARDLAAAIAVVR